MTFKLPDPSNPTNFGLHLILALLLIKSKPVTLDINGMRRDSVVYIQVAYEIQNT